MTWWQTLIVAIVTLIVTKTIDLIGNYFKEKRFFKKYRMEYVFNEIEELKNELGKIVELALSWKSYEQKQDYYIEKLKQDHNIIGKYNKYPKIAEKTRDIVHLCSVIAYCERESKADSLNKKQELHKKFEEFTNVCNEFIEKLYG